MVPPFDLREYADKLGDALEDSAWQETMSRENRAAAGDTIHGPSERSGSGCSMNSNE